MIGEEDGPGGPPKRLFLCQVPWSPGQRSMGVFSGELSADKNDINVLVSRCRGSGGKKYNRNPMAIDQFGRNIHYLRISLTDHCNLRCIYCMPVDQTFRPNPELMQDDEIALLTRLFASLGFDKIRLTGGEPTVRNHIVEIVRTIASTPGIRSVATTTNGILLKKLAQPLAEAGLRRRSARSSTLFPYTFLCL